MISQQTFITLLREKNEDRTALLQRLVEVQLDINRILENQARQQRIEQRQVKGR